jgi:hypothetical protein
MKVKEIGTVVLLCAVSACAGDSAAPAQGEGTRSGPISAAREAVFTPSGNRGCSTLRMSETGIMGEDGQWHAHGLISIGGGPVQLVTSVTANTGFRPAGRAARGSETWTVTVENAGTFIIEGSFTLAPGSTPGMVTLAESGEIGPGTGDFSNASGRVVINGPALLEDDVHATWLGSVLGEICP